jgi:hypothetical protein
MACGFTFTDDGRSVIHDVKEIANIFSAATEGNKTLQDVFEIERMDPAQKAAITAKLLEYGTMMWFDGLKQGLLLGAIQESKNGKVE